MNLFKKNGRKDTLSFNKKINPQHDNQVNSHKENHANSKSEGNDTIEKDVANAPKANKRFNGENNE